MRYFTYIAEQAFKTSANGERLFYRGGPWSRPYIIPDAATEQRLFKKNVWMLRGLLGGLIIGQPFLFLFFPNILHEPYWFLVYFVVIMVVFGAIGRLVFARDLRGLRRTKARLRPRSFYSQTAQKHSTTGLILGFLGSILFIAGGVWILSARANYALGILSIAFFGLCAVAWGYALYLKLAKGESSKEPDDRG